MYLCRTLTGLSLAEIATAFGRRDHTTVIHAHDRIEESLRENPELNEIIKFLIEELK
jgi:chromosomal replication initiator protein